MVAATIGWRARRFVRARPRSRPDQGHGTGTGIRVSPRIQQQRGFTLIEVLVALFIVALGIGALLSTLTSAATTIDHLRDKSFAEWIALNQITQARLAALLDRDRQFQRRSRITRATSGTGGSRSSTRAWPACCASMSRYRALRPPSLLHWRLPWDSWARSPFHPMAGSRHWTLEKAAERSPRRQKPPGGSGGEPMSTGNADSR